MMYDRWFVDISHLNYDGGGVNDWLEIHENGFLKIEYDGQYFYNHHWQSIRMTKEKQKIAKIPYLVPHLKVSVSGDFHQKIVRSRKKVETKCMNLMEMVKTCH